MLMRRAQWAAQWAVRVCINIKINSNRHRQPARLYVCVRSISICTHTRTHTHTHTHTYVHAQNAKKKTLKIHKMQNKQTENKTEKRKK